MAAIIELLGTFFQMLVEMPRKNPFSIILLIFCLLGGIFLFSQSSISSKQQELLTSIQEDAKQHQLKHTTAHLDRVLKDDRVSKMELYNLKATYKSEVKKKKT